MKALLIASLFLVSALPLELRAQGISQLQQFTSTTSPAAAITQTVYGKAFRLSGQSSGCAQFSANGTLTSTGVACGAGGGGNSFSYPFPSNATTTNITFTNGLTGALTGNASTATALAANGANCSAGSYPLGVDASGNVENCTAAGGGATFSYPFPSDATTTVLTLTNGASISKLTNLTSNGFIKTSSGNGTISVDTSTYLTTVDISANTNLAATWPLILTNDTLSFGGISTSSPLAAASGLLYATGVNTVASVSTSSSISLSITGNAGTASTLAADPSDCSAGSFALGINAAGTAQNCTDAWTEAENTAAAYAPQARQLTIAGTANQITSSAGAQTLAADRTWTLSIPSLFRIQQASTTDFSANTLAVGSTATTSISSAGTLKIQSLSGLLLGTSGTVSAYAGASACSANNFVTTISSVGGTTCGTASISGVALGGSLFAHTHDSTLSGTSYNGSAAVSDWGLNLGNANIWTARQNFANASSTLLSGIQAWFGGTATSTFTLASGLGIGTSSPVAAGITLDRGLGFASSTIVVYEYRPATSTASLLNCNTSTQTKWRLGFSATTLTLTGLVPGQSCRIVVENPNGTAGALTWAAAAGYTLAWAGGAVPTQTTTANSSDVWSFIATQASSSIQIIGAATTNVR